MFTCPLCSKTFVTRAHLQSHTKTHTKEKPHKCLICSAAFGHASNLKTHEKCVHGGQKIIRKKNSHCPLCSYKCDNSNKLRIHFRKHSDQFSISCSVASCGFKTKYEGNFKEHFYRVHNDERPYECPSAGCSYKSKRRGDLKKHVRLLSNEKPFTCKVTGCDYACKIESYLINHTSRAHSDEKPFKCSLCDFQAKTRAEIIKHEYKHTKTKRFQCRAPNCGVTSSVKGNFNVHFDRKHRTKETLHCSFPNCGFQTNLQLHYDRHKKAHNKEEKRKHVCSLCFSRFRYLGKLRSHIQRHVKEKPYSCSLCKYTTGYHFELVNHAKRIHHIHVTPCGKEDKVKNCRTCGWAGLSYRELVFHSMSHLKPVVVLERLRVQTM